MSTTRWLPLGVAVLLLAASGCRGQSFPVEQLGLEHPVWTRDGLYLVEQNGPGALFLTPTLPKLDGYDSIVVDEIRLGFKDGGPEFNAVDRKRAVAMVRRNIMRRLSAFRLQRAEEAGPGTLRLRIAITNIDYQPLFIKEASNAILNPSGGAAIMLEFRDGFDNRRLLVYAQNRRLPFGVYLGPQRVGAQRIADAFSEYSLDLARSLGKAERGELPGPRTQAKISLKP